MSLQDTDGDGIPDAYDKNPYTPQDDNPDNPYYQDDRNIVRNFLVVKPQAYENELVEEFVILQKRERLLLKIIFVGVCMLLYSFL